ncbi:heavy metal-associated isoprenylated plant protein 33-like [Sphaerodactylus townsendi]|uniref:heavy metal-associated isoprenylated plant protein 33-like n=1 Tax=Sphaerodactylus townsendi TaxID=933632 RepID=UPI002026B1C8|nr:heavy metal-associated isoprenylated plant protein 33-like [Sphaerodactylus townsendi]
MNETGGGGGRAAQGPPSQARRLSGGGWRGGASRLRGRLPPRLLTAAPPTCPRPPASQWSGPAPPLPRGPGGRFRALKSGSPAAPALFACSPRGRAVGGAMRCGGVGPSTGQGGPRRTGGGMRAQISSNGVT